MSRAPTFAWASLAIAAGWVATAGLAVWSGRETPVDARPADPAWVSVTVPAGSPAARGWAHFLACSGLANDPVLMRSTLLLNDAGDEAVWRRAPGQDIPVRVALKPVPGDLAPAAETIIGEAPLRTADCGAMP